MRGSLFREILRWLVLGALLGCSGAATVPAPLAEIPSVVSIPDDVSVDVSQVSSPGSSGPGALQVKRLTAAELFGIIRIGPDTVESINNDLLPGLLTPFNIFEIPVAPQVTTFEGVREEADSPPQVFKFDFADFDFNGDGAKDGFTGCTCPVGCAIAACPSEAPLSELKRIGFRVWIQDSPGEPFRPALAGFFDRLPVKDDPATPANEENPGKGQFRVGIFEGGDEFSERLSVGVIYDHKDPAEELNKSTESFLINEVTDAVGKILNLNKNHSLVAQVARTEPGGKRYLEKTVKTVFESFDSGVSASEFYIGRFRDDTDFWSGSFTREGTEESIQLPTTCARISEGSEVEPEICQDLGIDTSGESFLRGALDSDVLFPADFPPQPPF